MHTILKYLLPLFLVIISILFYFRYTESGQKNAYTLLSVYASHKSGLDINIKELNFHQFPYIRAKVLVEEEYHINIDGFVKNGHLDLRYTLNSACLKSNICTFDDMIIIKGKAIASKDNITVTGNGDALGGSVDYSFHKGKHIFEDVILTLNDVNSSKLFSLLDQKAIFKGDANASMTFEYISEEKKKGSITYDVKDNSFYDIEAKFHARINIVDNNHTFNMNILSPHIQLHLKDGKYNQDTKYGHANYVLDIEDLSQLKELFNGTYAGGLHAKGEMIYDNQLLINGTSTDLGGKLHFKYAEKILKLNLIDISFKSLMHTLNTKPIVEAKTTGEMVFDIENKEMQAKVHLNAAKLLSSSITRNMQKKFDLHLEDEVFHDSSITLHFKDKALSSNLKLANDNVHLILTDTKLNETHTALDTYIDLKTPKHSAKGKLVVRGKRTDNNTLDDIYLNFDGTVEEHYNIKIDGLINESFVNIDYTLSAARLPSNVCTIVDDINLSGHLSGSSSRLRITGEGKAMEGNINYSGIKIKDDFEDVNFNFSNIHALKLFTLLGYPTFPNGKADIVGHFSTFNEKYKQGKILYVLKNGTYENLPLTLKATVEVKAQKIMFSSNATLSSADINISQGLHNLDTNSTKAFYSFSTPNLAPLQPLIGDYIGPFQARGEIHHNDGFKIRGLSRTFGGMTDFFYKKDMLIIDLEKISFKRFMGLFPYPHILDAEVNGNINYDYLKEKLLVHTDLNNTKFLNSKLVRTVYEKSGVNMLKEVFPNSTLRATYQNKVLLGDVILKNTQSHFYLTNTKMDGNNNTVNAYFDLRMQGQEFSGKVYGSLDDPKVNLNMQKLIRYQMDKQLDSYMGKGNRKMMEKMPMGGVAKDIAAGVGAGFMGMFF